MQAMALFWYNFDPTMTKDLTTHHAGCPVVIGHKWSESGNVCVCVCVFVCVCVCVCKCVCVSLFACT